MSSLDDHHKNDADSGGSSIDSLLEPLFQEFEIEWNRNPFPDIPEFITRITESLLNQVLGELIAMDLERRWSTDSPRPKLDRLPRKPLLNNYREILSGHGGIDLASPDLIVTEFEVRTKWGDRPDIDEFLTRFPDQQSAIRSQCEEIAKEPARPKLTPGNAKRPEDDADAPSPEDSYESLEPNKQIGDYFLREKLGKGAFGVVFRAEHCERHDTFCALKFIRPDRLSTRNSEKMVRRFQQEIGVLSQLPPHPNLVSITDSQDWQGVAWLAMEFIQGFPLDRLVAGVSPLAIADACEILRQAVVGVGHLQANDVTHRDLKPDNLLLTTEGAVKILDLGMARFMDLDGSVERLTPSGTGLGTPNYMAPEQWKNAKHVGVQADIYSLGCTLYFLLAGERPFVATGRNEVVALMNAHARAPVPDISEVRHDATRDLSDLIQRCMAKDPDDRPQSADELEALLLPMCDGADLPKLLGRCGDVPGFNQVSSANDSEIEIRKSPAEDLPKLGSGAEPQPVQLKNNGQGSTGGAADPTLDEVRPAGPQTDGVTPPVDGSEIPKPDPVPDSPSLEATLIERRDELEETHSEVTFKPRASSAVWSGGSGSGSFGSGVGTVSPRRRDVTFGKTGSAVVAEYEIGQILGSGGMGAVYSARQSSIDRTVAVKTVKTGKESQESQDKFLAEAVITGALEHPNIVPIYDLGANSKDDLFYAMKEVRGEPWRKTIDESSIDQNLDVLMKVADAIAFAHSKGVVHRDLKPDNVMIGEFGEVLVMDWGLALPTSDFEKSDMPVSLGTAGTPSYMSPEMAGGPWELLGPTCDVYLIGALLFRFVTGRNPHSGANQYAAIQAARDNDVPWPSKEDNVEWELIEIARTAMSTRPEDRYASVLDLQDALLQYRSHSQSRLLTEAATKELHSAELSHDDREFERAIASFEQALKLWKSNTHAADLLRETRRLYGDVALNRGDFDLAESQLDKDEPTHQLLREEIRVARAKREAQSERLERERRIKRRLVVAFVVVVSASAVFINSARVNEADAKTEAVERFVESQSAITELTDLADALRDYPLAQAERRKLLEAAVRYYERQASEVSKVPTLRLEQLRSLVRLGEIQNQLAEYDTAIKTWRRADVLADGLSDVSELEAPLLLLVAEVQLGLSRSLSASGQLVDAISESSSGISLLSDQLLKTGSSDARDSLAFALLNRAEIKERAGQLQTQQDDITSAISHFEQMDSQRGTIGQASARSLLARIQESLGEYARAEKTIDLAVAGWSSLVKQKPSNIDYIDGLSTSQIDRTNILRTAGHDPVDAYSEVIASLAQLVELRPGIPRYRFNLGTSYTGLAWGLNRMGMADTAQESATEAIYIFEFLGGEYPEDQRFLYGGISAGLVFAEILKDRGETAQATDTLLSLEELLASDIISPNSSETKERLGELLLLRGLVESNAKNRAAAAQSLTRAVDVFLEISKTESGLPRYRDLAASGLFFLGHEAASAGDMKTAADAGRRALEVRKQLPEEARWLESHAWLLLYPPADDDGNSLAVVELASNKAALAVKLADGNPRFHRTFALASLRKDSLEQATASLKAAERFTPADSPKHPEQVFLQAILAAKQKNPDRAAAMFKVADQRMIEDFAGNPRLLLLRREAETLCRPTVPVGQDAESIPNAPTN